MSKSKLSLKSSLKKFKRLLSLPSEDEIPVRKELKIVHVGLESVCTDKQVEILPAAVSKITGQSAMVDEDTSGEPLYDEINFNPDMDEKEETEAEEDAYSYTVLRRCEPTKRSQPPKIKPRPKSIAMMIDVNGGSDDVKIGREFDNWSGRFSAPLENKEEEREEEERFSYGHYDDITEFQGRMFLLDQTSSRYDNQEVTQQAYTLHLEIGDAGPSADPLGGAATLGQQLQNHEADPDDVDIYKGWDPTGEAYSNHLTLQPHINSGDGSHGGSHDLARSHDMLPVIEADIKTPAVEAWEEDIYEIPDIMR